METFRNFINVLSLPQWSFTLSLIAFVAAMKTRFLWTKKGGLTLLVVGTASYVGAMFEHVCRATVTQSMRRQDRPQTDLGAILLDHTPPALARQA